MNSGLSSKKDVIVQMAYNKPKRGDLDAIWEMSCKSFQTQP